MPTERAASLRRQQVSLGLSHWPRQRGVALLEVIVAMVLLSSTGLALFSWINQSLATARRVADADAQARLKLNALALIEGLNPAEQARGELDAGPQLKLSWQSRLVQPLRRTQGIGEVPGRWWVGLYELSVAAREMADGPELRFTVLRAGWQLQAPALSAPTP